MHDAPHTETDLHATDELTDDVDVEGFRHKLPGVGHIPQEPPVPGGGGGGGLVGDLAGGLWKYTFKDTYDALKQTGSHYF